MPTLAPLPPTLEAYYQKIRNPRRLALRKRMTKTALANLFAVVQARYRQVLASQSINPNIGDGDSVATGQLLNSLRVKAEENKDGAEVSLYTTARHFEFVDTGEYRGDNEVSPQRIQIWLEARFGIPKGTDPSTPVQIRDDQAPIHYGRLVALITNSVRERLQEGFYRGLQLTKVIGDTITLGPGARILDAMFDGYVSLYSLGPVRG